LFDLADRLPPSATLHGFDISGEQYSPKEWIPGSVTLYIWNALEEPAHELLYQYDVVHLRLFMIIVQDYDPRPLLRNCKKLMKPGGQIILEEIDLSSSKVVTSSPLSNVVLLQQEEENLKKHEGIRWIGALPQILEELGFCEIQVERVDQLGWKTKMWQQQQLLVNEEYTNNYVEAKYGPEEAEVRRQHIRNLWVEVQQGSVLGVCLQTIVARAIPNERGERLLEENFKVSQFHRIAKTAT